MTPANKSAERNDRADSRIQCPSPSRRARLELGWYLEDGDTIELEVEKIGILKNKVVRQA